MHYLKSAAVVILTIVVAKFVANAIDPTGKMASYF
jgi:hypothetical protein